jgi:hypothetical protein
MVCSLRPEKTNNIVFNLEPGLEARKPTPRIVGFCKKLLLRLRQ